MLQQRGVVERLLGVTTNESELAAMVSYAQAFPNGLVALVDTYDVMKSGVPNFIIVSLALLRMGCNPVGIRLDSGDLAFFSKWARKTFAGKLMTDIHTSISIANPILTGDNKTN